MFKFMDRIRTFCNLNLFHETFSRKLFLFSVSGFLFLFMYICIYYKNNQQVVKKILTSKKLFGQKNNPIALTISWEFIVNPYFSSIGKLADFCIIQFRAYLVTWRDIIYWSHITKKIYVAIFPEKKVYTIFGSKNDR